MSDCMDKYFGQQWNITYKTQWLWLAVFKECPMKVQEASWCKIFFFSWQVNVYICVFCIFQIILREKKHWNISSLYNFQRWHIILQQLYGFIHKLLFFIFSHSNLMFGINYVNRTSIIYASTSLKDLFFDSWNFAISSFS